MRRLFNGMLWMAVILLAATATRSLLARRASVELPASGPYTLTRVETWVSTAGESRGGSRQTVALRSDGSTMSSFERLSVEARFRQIATRRILLMSGERIRVDDIRGLTSTTWNPSLTELLSRPDARHDCAQGYSGRPTLGPDQRMERGASILGYQVIRLQRRNTTAWYAPSLDCAMLRLNVVFDEGSSLQEVQMLTRGEPSPELFAVPGDYREVSPAIFSRREPNDATMASREAFYHAHRPPTAAR